MNPYRFRVMNTNIELFLEAEEHEGNELANLGRQWLEEVEGRFSRFRADSELSRINRLAGERCLVSPDMLEVLRLADAYRGVTEGVFQPFVLEALEKAGYDRSFDLLGADSRKEAEGGTEAGMLSADPARLDIDPIMKSVLFPRGRSIDLGGIVKSWAVKRLAAWFTQKMKIPRGLVNAGGDLTAWGGGVEPWLVGIENPWKPEEEAGILNLADGSAATSSKLGRAWVTSRGVMHHLIDPSTMAPSRSDVVQCTVAGPDPTDCEIWAKVLCIAGSEQGLKLFSRHALLYEAVLFTVDSQTLFYGKEDSLGARWEDLAVDRVVKLEAEADFL